MAVGSVIARIITQYSDKGSKAAQRDITKLGKQFDAFSKRVFKAFAVAGAAVGAFAIKVGKDAVEAAIADQKSQVLLANALRNTVGATDENIVATEAYISAMQKQFAIADDDLRPSLAALAAVTGDLAQAQGLQNVAIDVAAGTGKDLASVTQAIVKAYQGNLGALRRLGVPLEDNIIKTKDFNAAIKALAATYAGAGTTSANSFEGQLRGLQLTYNEIIEQLGYALIPVLQNVATFITGTILPALEAWVSANKDQVASSLQDIFDFSVKAAKAIGRFFKIISDNLQIIKNFAAIMVGLFVGAKVFAGITAMVAAIGALRVALGLQTVAATQAAVATSAATGGANLLAAGAALLAFAATTGFALSAMNKVEQSTENTNNNLQQSNSHLADLERQFKGIAGTSKTTFDFTNKTSGATKKLTAEQQKRLDVQKAITKAKLDELGITNVSTVDPISLEAARLNLVKEGAILELKRLDDMRKFNEEQALANVLSARYADILGVIADRQVSSVEISLLAKKWGESEEAVIKYLAYATKAPLPEGWNDPGNQAAQGWNAATEALNNYYRSLGNVPIPVIPNAPSTVVPQPPTPALPSPSILPSIPSVPSAVIPSEPGMASLGGVTPQDIADAFGSSTLQYLDDIFRRDKTTGQVTINVTGTGGLSDETKKEVVNAVVEASGSGYSTSWYRTTGGRAII